MRNAVVVAVGLFLAVGCNKAQMIEAAVAAPVEPPQEMPNTPGNTPSGVQRHEEDANADGFPERVTDVEANGVLLRWEDRDGDRTYEVRSWFHPHATGTRLVEWGPQGKVVRDFDRTTLHQTTERSGRDGAVEREEKTLPKPKNPALEHPWEDETGKPVPPPTDDQLRKMQQGSRSSLTDQPVLGCEFYPSLHADVFMGSSWLDDSKWIRVPGFQILKDNGRNNGGCHPTVAAELAYVLDEVTNPKWVRVGLGKTPECVSTTNANQWKEIQARRVRYPPVVVTCSFACPLPPPGAKGRRLAAVTSRMSWENAPAPWTRAGYELTVIGVNPLAWTRLPNANERRRVVLHEVLHTTDYVNGPGRVPAGHDDGDNGADYIFSMSRHCAGCPHRAASDPNNPHAPIYGPGSSTLQADCLRASGSTDEKLWCGEKGRQVLGTNCGPPFAPFDNFKCGRRNDYTGWEWTAPTPGSCRSRQAITCDDKVPSAAMVDGINLHLYAVCQDFCEGDHPFPLGPCNGWGQLPPEEIKKMVEGENSCDEELPHFCEE